MADKPIIFNEQEQLRLQELQGQNEAFNAWGQAISRSLHSGQDAVLVANLINFLKNLIDQNNKNAEEVKSGAQKRMVDESDKKAS